MATIFIDGIAFDVPEGKQLLETCLSLGINVPYFCWHPAIESVGACRQCAVIQYRDEHDTQGRIVMSCMIPVKDGMRVSISAPEAVAFRKAVAEWLMLNHPHDCPICDEGGECHLQDMIVMIGHTYRRTSYPKRTYQSQELGPFIHQEMNRCIQCYRCVRFYRDYAGGEDFDVFASHDSVFFGRQEPGTLESPFSGNLIEICPTGVFTDKTYREHYIRKWDLQQAPTVCTGCGLGCNVFASERYGVLRRIRTRYSHEVNGHFLCDRGRFGYTYVNGAQRRKQVTPSMSRPEAVKRAGAMIRDAGEVLGIGSPRASVESNFLLRKLVGEKNFFAGVSSKEEAATETVVSVLRESAVRSATLKEIETCDAVIVLGEDPVNSAPLLELALKQSVFRAPRKDVQERLKIVPWDARANRVAVQDRRGPMYAATPYPTSIDRFASGSYHGAPQDLARFGEAVAHLIDEAAGKVEGLDQEAADLARRVADDLKAADKPLVVSGTSCGSTAVIESASNIARALYNQGRDVRQFYVVPEQNSLGLAMFSPRDLSEAVDRVGSGEVGLVVVVENDLDRRCLPKDVDVLLGTAPVLSIDSTDNATVQRAKLVLPASTFAEASGTAVNNEGRAQRFFRVMEPVDPVQESWKWLAEIAATAGEAGPTALTLDGVLEEIECSVPAFAGIKRAAPGARDRLRLGGVPRQSLRYSGRTAIHAAEDIREHRVHDDPDSPLRYSMEGHVDRDAPALIPEYWSPGWNSVQALNRFQEEVGGRLHGGESGVVLLGRNGAGPGEAAAGAVPERARVAYVGEVPREFVPQQGRYLALPYRRIFGGEELSSLSPVIIARASSPYAAVSSDDPEFADTIDGTPVTIHVDTEPVERKLPLRRMDGIPAGIVLLPDGHENWGTARIGYATVQVSGG